MIFVLQFINKIFHRRRKTTQFESTNRKRGRRRRRKQGNLNLSIEKEEECETAKNLFKRSEVIRNQSVFLFRR